MSYDKRLDCVEDVERIAENAAAYAKQMAEENGTDVYEELHEIIDSSRDVFITHRATLVCTHSSHGINGAFELARETFGQCNTVEQAAYAVLWELATQHLS